MGKHAGAFQSLFLLERAERKVDGQVVDKVGGVSRRAQVVVSIVRRALRSLDLEAGRIAAPRAVAAAGIRVARVMLDAPGVHRVLHALLFSRCMRPGERDDQGDRDEGDARASAQHARGHGPFNNVAS